MHFVITMPVYNDWEAASLLCELLCREASVFAKSSLTILLINDGSSVEPQQDLFKNCRASHLRDVKVLFLGRNLGHQRAIAISLTYIQQNIPCDAVVVMDADGEDRASDIPRLIESLVKQRSPAIVFAERGRRVEGALFKTFYFFYRMLHRFATGTGIRVGNFSVIPFERLNNLVVLPELWNHYAAAVLKSRIPYTTIRADRGTRLHGRSKMNFVSLVIHGLSALFAHHELVGTRIFVSLLAVGAALLGTLTALAAIWTYRGWEIPLWEIISVATVVLLGGQLLAISFGLVFSIMMARINPGFLPVRDYSYFVLKCTSILPSVQVIESRAS